MPLSGLGLAPLHPGDHVPRSPRLWLPAAQPVGRTREQLGAGRGSSWPSGPARLPGMPLGSGPVLVTRRVLYDELCLCTKVLRS